MLQLCPARDARHADGSVNYDKLQEIIEDQIAKKPDSIVICGTTGEASTLTDNEKITYQKRLTEVRLIPESIMLFNYERYYECTVYY